MIKKIFAGAFIACAALGAMAAGDGDGDTMYLIKGDHVVGKYSVDDVDYVSFRLPEGVQENDIWLQIDSKSKNTVEYTVNTISPLTAYAHNIVSYYDVNYTSLDSEGESFENLTDEKKVEMLKLTLATSAYVGVGTQTFNQRDYEYDGGSSSWSRFSVVPGTHYYLCAWEVDPNDQSPKDFFTFIEFDTDAPGKSYCDIDFTLKGLNDYGVAFDVTGSDVYYVRTAWGPASAMDLYAEVYGVDFLMGTFGEVYELDFLQGFGDLQPDVENATWPLNGSGEYVLYVRAYDADGDMTEKKFEFSIQEEVEVKGPEINILSKVKGPGFVSVNFEITPSNIAEGYVRLCGENFVDDRLNMGYELYEVAMGGDAIDITNDINTTGEYTFSSQDVDEEWKALLIYAVDADGRRTTQRINFYPDTESEWSIYNPVYKAPVKTRCGARMPQLVK